MPLTPDYEEPIDQPITKSALQTTNHQQQTPHRMDQPLLELRNLTVAFDTERGQIRPVRNVSLSIFPGQTVALVGESGCGKSVSALSVLRLIPQPPGQILGGQILFDQRDLLKL